MRLFAVLILATLAGCGGESTTTSPAPAAPASTLTGGTLVIGGNEVFDGNEPRDYGPCATTWGVKGGDSAAILGVFQLGALNLRPSAVAIVANAFELTYADRWRTLDNYTGATIHATAAGARVTLVGVPGADDFNAALRGLAAAYGAAYAPTMDSVRCDK